MRKRDVRVGEEYLYRDGGKVTIVSLNAAPNEPDGQPMVMGILEPDRFGPVAVRCDSLHGLWADHLATERALAERQQRTIILLERGVAEHVKGLGFLPDVIGEHPEFDLEIDVAVALELSCRLRAARRDDEGDVADALDLLEPSISRTGEVTVDGGSPNVSVTDLPGARAGNRRRQVVWISGHDLVAALARIHRVT